MTEKLLSCRNAAASLGLGTATLYDWLSQSDAGTFMLRGQPTTIHYFQGGGKGQGRIKIPQSEVSRLLSLMVVIPRPAPIRKSPAPRRKLQQITTKPGRPDD